MCGIIGIISRDSELNKIIFAELLVQSQIRGKHSTGYSYLEKGRVNTVRSQIPAERFVEEVEFADSEIMIGHTRYSTSNQDYPQPIYNKQLSVVHNGVITQEDPVQWKRYFKDGFETENDTELLLKCFLVGKNPLTLFPDASIATGILRTEDLSIACYRNTKRPLWLFNVADEIFGFASTKDIIKRTFENIGIEDYSVEEALPYIYYSKKVSSKYWKREAILPEYTNPDLQISTKVEQKYL